MARGRDLIELTRKRAGHAPMKYQFTSDAVDDVRHYCQEKRLRRDHTCVPALRPGFFSGFSSQAATRIMLKSGIPDLCHTVVAMCRVFVLQISTAEAQRAVTS